MPGLLYTYQMVVVMVLLLLSYFSCHYLLAAGRPGRRTILYCGPRAENTMRFSLCSQMDRKKQNLEVARERSREALLEEGL